MASRADIIAGLALIAKYDPDGADAFNRSSDGYGVVTSGYPPREMDDADADVLDKLGWLWDETEECWYYTL